MQELGVEENSEKNSFDKPDVFVEEKNCAESVKICQESSGDDRQRWETVMRGSYPAPQPQLSRTLGRRRELVKNFIRSCVFEETIKAIVADPQPEPISPSEYVDNYCHSKFIPFIDRTEYDLQLHVKYPLYGGSATQSYYKCQLDSGTLKARSEISDFNQPFRRSCTFTTPPDLALREPTGGY